MIAAGQSTTSRVDTVTVYSQDENFYLQSIPFDDKEPSLRGKTLVFQKGSQIPIYTFERGFDSVNEDSNNLVLSNNGELVFYLIPWGENEKIEGLKSITIYKNGKIVKSFTKAEITGCNYEKERCDLLYSNYDKVIDRKKSWTGSNKRVFIDGVSEKDKFLSNFPLFTLDEIIYITDSKLNTHLFDLNRLEFIETKPFDEIYELFKDKAKFNKIELRKIDDPTYFDYPKLRNGKDTSKTLAKFIGMKSVDILSKNKESSQYKLYYFTINSSILKDGSVEIEEIEASEELPKEKIIEFFKTNKFDSSQVPEITDKWYLDEVYFFFRKADARLARQEEKKRQAEIQEIQKRNLIAEEINGVYIPKDLGEAFIELDKLLKEVVKNEMQALTKREDMIKYHFGLGMWIRNNWSLWGGSRLQKYFTDKGVTHPDDMSGIILNHYYDWLKGKTETWKDWGKNPKQ